MLIFTAEEIRLSDTAFTDASRIFIIEYTAYFLSVMLTASFVILFVVSIFMLLYLYLKIVTPI